MNYIDKINESAEFLRSRIEVMPSIALVLGSGLGAFEDKIRNKTEISYGDIPNFPISTVTGHSGKLIFGTVSDKPILAMSGRFHYYEGYEMNEITFPIRVMKILGIKVLILTNAAGGVNTEYEPGDLMILNDHIKFFDQSPLRGKNIDEFGPRFNDMSNAYPENLREIVKVAAYGVNIPLREGVYAFMPGPSFETPAEIKMLRVLGADAVGMSTVPEVIVANHCGINVLAISCITNMAAGILGTPLSHEEVMQVGSNVSEKFSALMNIIINNISV